MKKRVFAITAIAAVILGVGAEGVIKSQPAKLSGSHDEGKTQTIEGPKGLAIPVSVVSPDIREPLRPMAPDELQIQLRAKGNVLIGGADLTIGSADQPTNELTYLVADSIVLKRGACIVTNGNPLVIFVNTIISEDGCIVSFKPDHRKAHNGGTGNPGGPGLGGGLVSIHVIKTITGIIHTDLSGQDGGDGGASNAVGAAGQSGVKGDGSSSGPFGCNKGGGNGTPGAPGGVGGTGGDGGSGGAGGSFELFNIGQHPIPEASYSFIANPGRGGFPGAGALGGQGGQGGDGGDGGGFCSGGRPGPNGTAGPAGPSGHQGTVGLVAGTIVVKNLDLEFFSVQEPTRLSERFGK